MKSYFKNPLTKIFDAAVESRVSAKLSTMAETDETIFIGTRLAGDVFKDRFNVDRQKILRETLLAWRTNPIARRIIDLIVEFVVGDGLNPKIENKPLSKFIDDFWNNPLNDLDEQIPEWVAEQSRSGDLFITCSVDAVSGMMYVRAVPSELIDEIQTVPNDYRQERFYIPQDITTPPYEAYDINNPNQTQFMLHFPINRPVGAVFGESDLTPVLRWLGRLSTLLNDRVIMNHLRNLITYIVKGTFQGDKKARLQREAELNANPPNPGAIIVSDETEWWGVLAPNLQSFDANADILAIKKHIAAGVGIPLHFLAEPESSTRTTAAAAGTPTFRKFKTRQSSIKRALAKICMIAALKKHEIGKTHLNPKHKILIEGDDITEHDNSRLALAAARIEPVLGELYDRELINEATYLSLFYLMLGEDFDSSDLKLKGLRRDINKTESPKASVSEDPTDPKDDDT